MRNKGTKMQRDKGTKPEKDARNFVPLCLCAFVTLCLCAFFTSAVSADVGSQVTQGGSAYAITTPFAQADLFEIQTVQSADVMYLTHQNYPPQILSRYGDTNWTIEDVNLDTGPFLTANLDEDWTITPSATTGAITLTAAADTFLAGHVNALWQLTETVDSNTVSGTWSQTAADTNSDSVAVGNGQSYTMMLGGTWWATVSVQRSYDDESSWETVYTYSDHFSNVPFTYRNTETNADADYRLSIESLHTYGGRADKYVLNYNLTALSYFKQGIVKISGVSDARTASADVLYALGSTDATWRWAEGAFSDYQGYPAAVAFFQERLCFGGTTLQPQTIWLSQTDSWHNFTVNADADSALSWTLASDQVNAIRWMVGGKSLLIGTSGAEWKLSAPAGKALTAAQYELNRQSNYGSEPIQALAVNDSALFVQRQAKKIRRMQYAFDRDNYISEDVSLLAEHLTGEGVKEMAFQRAPYTILWVVTDMGDLLSLTLEESQQVVGWARHTFDGDCESVACIPGDGEDEVWVIIKRTIEEVDYRYIEQLQPFDWGDDDADAFFVDCGLSWDGEAAVSISNITQADPMVVTAPGHSLTDGQQIRLASVSGMTEVNNTVYTVHTVSGSSFQVRDASDSVDVNSINFTAYTSGGTVTHVENAFSGLDHLEGKTVVAAADAGYAGSYTVSSGAVTLSDYYNRVHIGLSYTARLKPMKLEFPATGGRLQTLTKRITATTLRLYESMGADVGPSWTSYDTPIFRDAADPLEAPPPYFTGDKRLLFPGGWETAGDLCIQQSLPLPFTLISVGVEFEVNE